MSKHKRCDIDCCHQMECCPRGFVEHVQHYLYLRKVCGIGFLEYWAHEVKNLIGLNRANDDE